MISIGLLVLSTLAQPRFRDTTEAAGLGGLSAARVVLADLNGDTRPDAVIDHKMVFINRAGEDGKGVRFVKVEAPNLPPVEDGDCLVFADFDNDGHADALVTRNDTADRKKVLPTEWCPGRGDGTFQDAIAIPVATPKTTMCVAVGDVNNDGLLDIYLGNWYTHYGESYEGFSNDLLIQRRNARGEVTFTRQPMSEDSQLFDEEKDGGGRPTYGALFVKLLGGERDFSGPPSILELNYGRRWNRLWTRGNDTSGPAWVDIAPALGLDGDEIRDGKYPEWLKERAKTDPRFAMEDEQPFRSNGNSFDAAVGDINGDGAFDLFVGNITHGWAGPSSDRSMILVAKPEQVDQRATDQSLTTSAGRAGVSAAFAPDRLYSLDRSPPDPDVHSWNQGDLFGAFIDADLDGRLDFLLSSGDYPDNQRLRIFRQLPNGSLADETSWSGLDNDGSQQLSIGDVDLDGDPDVLVGQTFFRYPESLKAGRTPSVKLFLNQAADHGGRSLVLILEGDPTRHVARDALGAVVKVEADTDRDPSTPPSCQLRQLVGIGGHAGKQQAFEINVGLGAADHAEKVTIWWPGVSKPTVLEQLEAGRHEIRLREAASP